MEYSGIQFHLSARRFVSQSFSEGLSCYYILRFLSFVSKQKFIR
jgi:hypothetical protein